MTLPGSRHPDGAVDVSVVIAARDAARTLPHQLRALADQRAGGTWEVLVADNGSTDGTREVVAAARAWLPGLRLVDAAAVRGAGAARNAAAEVARGDVLLFCDADDVVAPGWLAALHGALGRADLVAGRLEWQRLNRRDAQMSRHLPQDDGLQHTAPLPDLPCASSSNLGVRRELFRRLGGFDHAARYLQDTDLCWRAQLAGARLEFEPAAVVHMRLRPSVVGAWRQGRHSGMGQRWLAARYGELGAALAARRAAASGPAASRPGEDAAARRSWPARIVRRAALVGADVLRVRSRGDVARLSWSTGFGVGYALGGLPDPEPYPAAAAGALPV